MNAVKFARFDAEGRYVLVGVVPDSSPTLQEPDVYIGTVAPLIQRHCFVTNGPVDLPPRPDEAHVFDYRQCCWVKDASLLWKRIRAQRDRMLSMTDWTQLADVPASTRARFQAYRQALRDITGQADPLNATWPKHPDES